MLTLLNYIPILMLPNYIPLLMVLDYIPTRITYQVTHELKPAYNRNQHLTNSPVAQHVRPTVGAVGRVRRPRARPRRCLNVFVLYG